MNDWDAFAESMSTSPSDPTAREARDTLREGWDTAAESASTSRELTSIFGALERDLMAAWNTSGDASSTESFWNGMDVLAARCASVGSTVEYSQRDVRLSPRERSPALGFE